jgi:hypothetical protein
MQAIQTKFNNRHHRSRLEARVALMLHICGLPYHYEREGFEQDPGRYLPDFWCPTLRIFIEAKGWFPTADEIEKCQRLADDTQRRVAVICGDPGWETIVCCFAPGSDQMIYLPLPDFNAEIAMRAIDNARSARFEFGETPQVLPFPQPVAQPTAART